MFEFIRKMNESKKKESEVIDALLQASTYPNEYSIENIIQKIAFGDTLLSDEFKIAGIEIRNGASVEESLAGILKRNPEKQNIKLMVKLFIQAHRNKADNSKVFRNAAEDLMERQNLQDEKNIALMTQKYTLLLGGAVIVPLVLSMLFGLMTNFDFEILKEFYSTGNENKTELLGMIKLANLIYVGEYSIIASLFLAKQENNMKKALIYFLGIFPVSICCFLFGRLLLA
ncbi:MAG: hypothetical protein COT15_04895 [Candidatus Diapherotrites archaeon CG08_land_8_20_14_0_20_34_12]|nr:MAG: hypothetical protein COT15_04895 [Candidatus Diapherotrites archaeon CG08_land_8_20_14_0_20_34_12]